MQRTGFLLFVLLAGQAGLAGLAAPASAVPVDFLNKLPKWQKCRMLISGISNASDLDDPEVEAKLQAKKSVMNQAEAELPGLTFVIKGPRIRRGPFVMENYTYQVTSPLDFLYMDINYDVIKDGVFLGHEKKATLRARARYHWNEKKREYIFDKMTFHAKSEGIHDPALQGVSARSEIRGYSSKSKKEFEKARDFILSGETPDKAVEYFRSIIGPEGDLVPVLKTKQKRLVYYAMNKLPAYELSYFIMTMDRIVYRPLVDRNGKHIKKKAAKARERLMEIELADKVNAYEPKVNKGLKLLLTNIKGYFQDRYSMVEVLESKYVSGLNRTIFADDFEEEDDGESDSPGEPNIDEDV